MIVGNRKPKQFLIGEAAGSALPAATSGGAAAGELRVKPTGSGAAAPRLDGKQPTGVAGEASVGCQPARAMGGDEGDGGAESERRKQLLQRVAGTGGPAVHEL